MVDTKFFFGFFVVEVGVDDVFLEEVVGDLAVEDGLESDAYGIVADEVGVLNPDGGAVVLKDVVEHRLVVKIVR